MSSDTRRAPALSTEERRAMILDAAIPLFAEKGPAVTTRDIADAAGIAEGTIFRVFSDKQELCHAAVVKYMDPEPVRVALGAIDAAAPLEEKVRSVVAILRKRFGGVMGILSALGTRPDPHGRNVSAHVKKRAQMSGFLAAVLEPDASRLRIEPEAAARIIRLVVFASEIPELGGPHRVTDDELVDFILGGIARKDG